MSEGPFETTADFDVDVATACVQLVGSTGATGFQLRYSDDEQPPVWIAVATYARNGAHVAEAAAGLTQGVAVYRLVEALVDGGVCAHCRRPTCVSDDFGGSMPMESALCWYRYDPELKTFRRGCE